MIYDRFAGIYDRMFAPFEKGAVGIWRRETLSYLPENAEILEIGAGTGLNFKYYPKSRLAVASEISPKMLEYAARKTDSIELVQADALRLPFPDASFDAAFATLVLCSVADPEQVLREMQRILKPNSKIILLEHVRPNGLLGYFFDLLNFFTVRLFEDHFNRETAKIAESSGLKIIDVKTKAFGIVNLIICEVPDQ